MSTRTHILVPDELLVQVDAARGDVPRSTWFVRAAEDKLRLGRQQELVTPEMRERALEPRVVSAADAKRGVKPIPPRFRK